MVPNLAEGDRLVCEEPVRLLLGDLLIFPWPGSRESEDPGLSTGETTVHRLVRIVRDPIGGDRLVTRGDANGWFDPPIDPDTLIGRVRAVREASGRTYSVRTPSARAYALAVALHDLFWGELRAWGAEVDADLGGTGLARALGALDRRLLRLARRTFHARLHPPVEDAPGC